jgi:hypothetical protein
MTDGDKAQRERFIKKARELGCDEDEAHFRDALKQIVKPAKPKADPQKKG